MRQSNRTSLVLVIVAFTLLAAAACLVAAGVEGSWLQLSLAAILLLDAVVVGRFARPASNARHGAAYDGNWFFRERRPRAVFLASALGSLTAGMAIWGVRYISP